MKLQDPPEEGKQTMKTETKKQPKHILRKQTPYIFDPGFDAISSVRAWKRTCSKRDAGNVAATLLHVRYAESDVLLAGRSRQIYQRSFREEYLAVGYSGAFLGAQLDLTTAAGEEYITFSVSYVKKGSSDVSRVALATRAFPGTPAADDIKPWIENVRRLLS